MTTAKEIVFEDQARNCLLKGIKLLSNLVSCTIGPKGRNVSLEKSWGAPTLTNDGASIIKTITLKDKYENMGVEITKELVQTIKNKCGDGTTTGTIILSDIVENGIKMITAGASPISVKRGMDKAVEALVKEIEKSAIPLKTKSDIKSVATVSASGHQEIGELIAEAIERVGNSGAVSIQEGKTTETTIEIVNGMRFDRGYISPYLCTNSEKMLIELHHPQILLVDKKIASIHELLPILQAIATTGKELLIIAEEIEGDVLSTLVVNKLKGTLKVAAVKAPGFGDNRKAMLEDIAVLTGATVISEEVGIFLKDATTDLLGSADRVVITKDNTTIIQGKGSKEKIAARLKQLKAEIEKTDTQYNKEKLQERCSKLEGGVAVIHVGAATETELKQKKQMFDDSLSSTRAALENGIVPGGGLALKNASQAVSKQLHLEGDEALGATIILKACEAPLKKIVTNSGLDGEVILNELKQQNNLNLGFNAFSEKIEDLLQAGVIDPAKVVKTCLIHAASTAGIVLISEALIANADDDDESEKTDFEEDSDEF